MKRYALLVVVLLCVVVSPVFAQANLKCPNGSFGWYQELRVVPGVAYEISGYWKGTGTNHWIEVLFFNDDGRPVYDQLDSPYNASVISKVDGWGMNGKTIPDWEPITNRYFPSGMHTNLITATGTKMYVGLKAGTASGNVDAWFKDFSVANLLVNGDFSLGEYGWTRWGATWPGITNYEWNVVPEPSSIGALAGLLVSTAGFVVRRRGK